MSEMQTSKFKYVFGPVASRRLGRSLGVDLVRPKICSLNCIYCEAGATTELTLKRDEYVPAEDVLAELESFFAVNHAPIDWITFSGAGEPLLNSSFGYVASEIKRRFPQYRLCLLTNALALTDRNIWSELENVDLVIPSLDGSNEEEFNAVNRPAEGIDFAAFSSSLADFTQQFARDIVLELFIVPGVNDSDASIERFAEIIRRMKISKVQLNSLDRPGVVEDLQASTAENTRRFIEKIEPIVPVEAVGPFRYKSASLCSNVEITDVVNAILELIRRRPATVSDIAECCSIAASEAQQILQMLVQSGLVLAERKGARGDFFSVNVRHFQNKGE